MMVALKSKMNNVTFHYGFTLLIQSGIPLIDGYLDCLKNNQSVEVDPEADRF